MFYLQVVPSTLVLPLNVSPTKPAENTSAPISPITPTSRRSPRVNCKRSLLPEMTSSKSSTNPASSSCQVESAAKKKRKVKESFPQFSDIIARKGPYSYVRVSVINYLRYLFKLLENANIVLLKNRFLHLLCELLKQLSM